MGKKVGYDFLYPLDYIDIYYRLSSFVIWFGKGIVLLVVHLIW